MFKVILKTAIIAVLFCVLSNTAFAYANNVQVIYDGHIASDFDGYEEGNIYVMDDDSVWLQTSSTYHYHYCYHPEVKIARYNNGFILAAKEIKQLVVSVVPLKRYTISGESHGWEGETIFKLTDGSIWEQAEYYYRYNYKYSRKVYI